MRALEQVFLDLYKAHGAADSEGLAKKATDSFDLDQRDKRIYELRAVLTEETLSDRFGVSTRRVRQIVKAQINLKKIR